VPSEGGSVIRVVWPPHCDYLRAVGDLRAEAAGFLQRKEPGKATRWWRPGWWAVEQPTAADSIRTVADAEHVARFWPQGWADEFHLTRIDVACDVVIPRRRGHPSGFTFAHKDLFTGRGAKQVIEKKHELRTMYIGGRESPLMLRIYMKSERCNERDKQRWLEHGWNGRDDVWRIEYEFHRKAIPDGVRVPQDVNALWADGLARIRMCAVPPRTYAEQNRAPSHEWWDALGAPRKLTRRAVDMAGPPSEAKAEELLRALDKLAARGGGCFVARMMERLERSASIVAAGRKRKRNGQGEEDE